MQLFHGTTEVFSTPQIIIPDRLLDFGVGFYLTSGYEQAKKWALLKKKRFTKQETSILTFEFDENNLKNNELTCKIFKQVDEEWLDFVLLNRTDTSFNYIFDIVVGAIANVQVFTAITLFEGGFLNKQSLIENLKTWKYTDQFCFHTQNHCHI